MCVPGPLDPVACGMHLPHPSFRFRRTSMTTTLWNRAQNWPILSTRAVCMSSLLRSEFCPWLIIPNVIRVSAAVCFLTAGNAANFLPSALVYMYDPRCSHLTVYKTLAMDYLCSDFWKSSYAFGGCSAVWDDLTIPLSCLSGLNRSWINRTSMLDMFVYRLIVCFLHIFSIVCF